MNRANWWPGVLWIVALSGVAGCIEAPSLPPRPAADMGADLGRDQGVDMPPDDMGDLGDMADMTMCVPDPQAQCTAADECGSVDDGCGTITFCGNTALMGRCEDPFATCTARTCRVPTFTAEQVTNLPSISAAQSFGFTVALWEDWLFVGDPLGASAADPDLVEPKKFSGRVDIFRRDATGRWVFHSSLPNPSRGAGFGFGWAIVARDGHLVISAPNPPYDKLPEDSANAQWGHVTPYQLAQTGSGEAWVAGTPILAGGQGPANGAFGGQMILTQTLLLVTRNPFAYDVNTIDSIAEGGPIAVSAYGVSNGWTLQRTVPLVETSSPQDRANPLRMDVRGDRLVLCHPRSTLMLLTLPQLGEAARSSSSVSSMGGCDHLTIGPEGAGGYPEVFTTTTMQPDINRLVFTEGFYQAGESLQTPARVGVFPQVVQLTDTRMIALHTDRAAVPFKGLMYDYTRAGDDWTSPALTYEVTIGSSVRFGRSWSRWGSELAVSGSPIDMALRHPIASDNGTVRILNIP